MNLSALAAGLRQFERLWRVARMVEQLFVRVRKAGGVSARKGSGRRVQPGGAELSEGARSVSAESR
jgi:hypothetical protein